MVVFFWCVLHNACSTFAKQWLFSSSSSSSCCVCLVLLTVNCPQSVSLSSLPSLPPRQSCQLFWQQSGSRRAKFLGENKCTKKMCITLFFFAMHFLKYARFGAAGNTSDGNTASAPKYSPPPPTDYSNFLGGKVLLPDLNLKAFLNQVDPTWNEFQKKRGLPYSASFFFAYEWLPKDFFFFGCNNLPKTWSSMRKREREKWGLQFA